MLNRRIFLGACGALVGAGLLGEFGCSNKPIYEVTVNALDDGQSVYQATARYYRLVIDARGQWGHDVLPGSRKVIAVGHTISDRWIFEIDGRQFDGSTDAVDTTRVHTGQVITWREV